MKRYDRSFRRTMTNDENQDIVAHFRVRLLLSEDKSAWFTKEETLMISVFYHIQTKTRTLSKTSQNYYLIKNINQWLFGEIEGKNMRTIPHDEMTSMQIWIKDRVIFEYTHQ